MKLVRIFIGKSKFCLLSQAQIHYMYEDLEVKESIIPGAGKGLFINRDVKKGERVVEYLGEIITWKECDIRAERNEGGYVFYINQKKCVATNLFLPVIFKNI